MDGKKASPTVALIDWQNPANNSFVFTEEFTVTRSSGVESRRPDIVCFVNGIPLVVLEAKRPDGNAKKGQVYGSDDRIRLIALDIANHFVKNIDEGLKGQLACDSKASAIKYKKYLDEAGLFESAVVMSPPDSREGNTAVDEATTPEVTQWWKDNVGSLDEQAYTKHLIERFDNDDSLKILIVVDKLLTGFDEPKNSVLYIDKPLKEHNLIQAIARVNRLHPKKNLAYS